MSLLETSQQSNVVVAEPISVLLGAKLLGATAGTLISLAYILPRGRREAYLRLTVGLVTGLLFGSTAGVKLGDLLGLLEKVSAVEITMMGAGFASLTAWWGLGVLKRLAERWPTSLPDPFKSADRPVQPKGVETKGDTPK